MSQLLKGEKCKKVRCLVILKKLKRIKGKEEKSVSITRTWDMRRRMVEIVRSSPKKKMTEPELKQNLKSEGLLKVSYRGSIGQTYYKALNECISKGELGETAELCYMEDKKGGKRKRATRVFHYIESGEDQIKEIFADLDYNAEKREFGKELEKLPSEMISTLLNKLEGILNNYSAAPAVIDFIISAIEKEHLATEKKRLVACLSQAVKKAAEGGNKALLAKIDESVEWLKGAMDSGVVDKVTGAEILLMIKNPDGLDVLLSLLDDAHLDQYGTTPYVALIFRFVKLLPQEKERVKQELYKVLREDKGRKTIRKSAAESILRRI